VSFSRRMIAPQQVTLGQVLSAPHTFGFEGWLFLPKEREWTWDAPGLVAAHKEISPEEDVDDEAAYPDEAKELHLRDALDMGTVISIIENLTQQTASPGDQLRLRAFHFYYDRDAFIDLKDVHE
jgi:hypothetical protein